MIKQIQLRGISHKPSDRLTADGGLEDCIDLRLEEQEHAPAAAPADVTDTLAPGLSEQGIDVLYIHKTNKYTNYVGRKGSKLVAYVNTSGNTWEVKDISSVLAYGTNPTSITSIGNILIYYVLGTTYYAIFKDGEYTDLGSGIPRPKVTFDTIPQAESRQAWNPVCNNGGGVSPVKYPGLSTQISDMTTKEFWEYILQEAARPKASGVVNEDAVRLYNDMATNIWSFVDEKRNLLIDSDTFVSPVLVRYAVRMYDGSYIYQSAPILLAGGTSHMSMQNILASIMDVNGILMFYYRLVMDQCYKATVSIELNDAGKWSEFIESVDVFMSTDILLPEENSLLYKGVDWSETPDISGATFTKGNVLINFKGFETAVQDGNLIHTIPSVSRNAFEEQMLKKANFYRVASFSLDKLPQDEELKRVSQDDLVVLPRLEEGDAHQIMGNGSLGTYNLRLVTGEQRVLLSPGHPEPQALVGGATGTAERYALFYYVRDSDGIEHAVQGFAGLDVIPAEMRAYVAYPDPKCTRAVLYKYNGTGYTKMLTIPMKEHPRLNSSYGFWGLDNTLWPSSTPTDGRVIDDNDGGLLPANDDSYIVRNRLALSEMQNPWFFPLTQRQLFQARIISAIPVTTALSAGQFGQFPLYVFTEDGIWTVSLTDEGRMAASHPVSRDVAVDGTVAQLDQAIVFVSDQGVMLLSGSQTSLLSPYMDGPQFSLEEVIPEGTPMREALVEDGWGGLVQVALDTTDFSDFIQGCRPLYDYTNRRVLFFNPSESYAYDYALDSQTWHKLSVPALFWRTLNGYPDALAVFNGAIFDWSVLKDYNVESASRKGLLLTRSLDLGEPDVRKAIKSIRIRGMFNHDNVKYILLGSMNGVKWQKLLSLRGGSYKTFRLLLLADLEPGERISWIDIDYEGRFGNKLR